MGLLSEQPTLHEEIAQRTGYRFEPFALIGVFHQDRMVENQMAIVILVICVVREAECAALVLP
jgi:hypothetical protein